MPKNRTYVVIGPTLASDFTDVLLEISKQILEGKKNFDGLYHYSNEGMQLILICNRNYENCQTQLQGESYYG